MLLGLYECLLTRLPNHSNNDVADGEGCDPGPDVGGEGFFFAVKEGEKQNNEYEGELHADLGVIDQRPFHGIGVVEGVADGDEADAGDGGGEGRVDKTGCNFGAGFDEGDQDPCHAC